MKQLRAISLIWLLPAVLFALSAAPAAQATQQRMPVPLITEHSFGQNGVPRATVPSGPLITEHSAGQNRPLHVSRQTVPLITEHSYGQSRPGLRRATGSNAGEASIQLARLGGFRWGDAGIGAGGAVALMLLVAGAALGVRRNRARRAYVEQT